MRPSRKEAPNLQRLGELCQVHRAQRPAVGAREGTEAKVRGRKRKERIRQKKKINQKEKG